MKLSLPRRSRIALAVLALVACPVLARSAPQSLYRGFLPATGEPRLLVILVSTPDLKPRCTREKMEARLFGRKDDGLLSLAEYYDQVSYGRLRLQGRVTEWLPLSLPMAAYAGSGYGLDYRRPDANLGTLVKDAVAAAVKAGVDLAPFDNDRDGHLDGLIVIHAGGDAAITGNRRTIWSRTDYLSLFGNGPLVQGPLTVDRFSILPEFFYDGAPDSIRVYAHETGHLLGLPDLYDWDLSSLGIGGLGLMGMGMSGAGEWEAVSLESFSKARLGWLSPRSVAGDTVVQLRPLELYPDAVRLDTPVRGEYFLAEHRAPLGVDRMIPGSGLLLWHVNERALYGNNFDCLERCALPPLIALVQADGENHLERKLVKSDPMDLFPGPEGLYRAVGADTGNPAHPFRGATTLAFNGRPTGVGLSAIELLPDTVRFRVTTSSPALPCRDTLCLQIVGQRLEEIRGNGDGFAGPGETARLRLTVLNLGVAAEGLTFEAEAKGIAFQKARARQRQLPAGTAAEIEFELRVPENPAAASWLEPAIKVTVKKPPIELGLKPKVLLGVPDLMIVGDGPHALVPYCRWLLRDRPAPYAVWDGVEAGLPPAAMVAACPNVLWLAGVTPLGPGYPDPERMARLRTVPAAGHRLIFSAFIAGGELPAEALALFGLRGVKEDAGIMFAIAPKEPTTGLPTLGMDLRFQYPYFPDPPLCLALTGSGQPLLMNARDRVVATLKPDGNGSVVFLGFPLEAVTPRQAAGLIGALAPSGSRTEGSGRQLPGP